MSNRAIDNEFEDKGPLWPTDQPRRYILSVINPQGIEMTLPAMGLSEEAVLQKAREVYEPLGWKVLSAKRDV